MGIQQERHDTELALRLFADLYGITEEEVAQRCRIQASTARSLLYGDPQATAQMPVPANLNFPSRLTALHYTKVLELLAEHSGDEEQFKKLSRVVARAKEIWPQPACGKWGDTVMPLQQYRQAQAMTQQIAAVVMLDKVMREMGVTFEALAGQVENAEIVHRYLDPEHPPQATPDIDLKPLAESLGHAEELPANRVMTLDAMVGRARLYAPAKFEKPGNKPEEVAGSIEGISQEVIRVSMRVLLQDLRMTYDTFVKTLPEGSRTVLTPFINRRGAVKNQHELKVALEYAAAKLGELIAEHDKKPVPEQAMTIEQMVGVARVMRPLLLVEKEQGGIA